VSIWKGVCVCVCVWFIRSVVDRSGISELFTPDPSSSSSCACDAPLSTPSLLFDTNWGSQAENELFVEVSIDKRDDADGVVIHLLLCRLPPFL